jgi:DNA-directed RNA polymerase specialized sigma24 family protein
MDDPADGVLLEAAKTDRAVFGVLFDRHAPAIYRFAAHRVGRGCAPPTAGSPIPTRCC